MKFYKFRAFVLIHLSRLLGKILFVENPPIPSVAALIEKDGKLLFLRHTYIKGYGLPGGVIKRGENLEEALRREVAEETGLEIISSKYFASAASVFRGIPTLTFSFVVNTSGTLRDSNEGTLEWLEPNQVINQMAYESGKKILQVYNQS